MKKVELIANYIPGYDKTVIFEHYANREYVCEM